MPFPKRTPEQANALRRADDILREAGLPTLKERAEDHRRTVMWWNKQWTGQDELIRAILQATGDQTETHLLSRVWQAACNTLHHRLGVIITSHYGV
jgi:hypothetical protein